MLGIGNGLDANVTTVVTSYTPTIGGWVEPRRRQKGQFFGYRKGMQEE